MNATGKRRLLKLADFLETAKIDGKFNMGTWSGGPRSVDEGKPACGTSACAVGWGTTIPSFRRAGLHLHSEEGWPVFKGHDSFDACAAFFDIEYSAAHDLFDPEGAGALRGMRGRRIVAKRLRNFVARQEATEAKQ